MVALFYILKKRVLSPFSILGKGLQMALFRCAKPIFHSEKRGAATSLHSEKPGPQDPSLHFFVFFHSELCYYPPQRW